MNKKKNASGGDIIEPLNVVGLRVSEDQADCWATALAAGDTDMANVFAGEAVGLIHDQPAAADILQTMIGEATELMRRGERHV